jgi:hypothetical protein
MGYNPLDERGTPVDEAFRPWSKLNIQPYDRHNVDPYTRCRVIGMNGIEVESIMFSHQFARHTDVPEVKQKLAELRRIDQQQQKAVNWLIPGDETTIEVTLGYEQIAVDLTAWLARSEPDPYLKQTYDFGLLEDFDHLYRYANLYELLQGKQAEEVCAQLTEIMPGRPTMEEHRHPHDDIRRHYDKRTADPLSKLHALTIVAAEQQTMNFYMTIGNRYMEPLARGLYAEIAMIEEQHVTQYESMLDPGESWFEQLAMHFYNEAYMYHSFASQESDARIRSLWEEHLDMEVGKLHVACDLMRRYDGKEPEEILPLSLPEPVLFEPNKEYVRQVLAEQVEWTADGIDFTPDKHGRYESWQDTAHGDGPVPSNQVIDDNIAAQGRDYRLVTEGQHPVDRLSQDAAISSHAGGGA